MQKKIGLLLFALFFIQMFWAFLLLSKIDFLEEQLEEVRVESRGRQSQIYDLESQLYDLESELNQLRYR